MISDKSGSNEKNFISQQECAIYLLGLLQIDK
jgi:hypothetical protein